LNQVLVEVLKYRATRDPKGRRNRNPTTQRMPWAMIILSVLVNGSEDPPLLVLPLPPVDEGLEAEVPVPMDPARLSEVSPISRCWVKLALGELEPGFVSPKAQMMYSLPRVPLTGVVNTNDGEEPVTYMTKRSRLVKTQHHHRGKAERTSLAESCFVATGEGLESTVGKT
jgi:hypothetical protein